MVKLSGGGTEEQIQTSEHGPHREEVARRIGRNACKKSGDTTVSVYVARWLNYSVGYTRLAPQHLARASGSTYILLESCG